MIGLRRFATTPVVALPTLSPDIRKGANSRVIGMRSFFACSGKLLTLILWIKTEAIGQRLATYEGAWIEIDAPLDIAVGSLWKQILRIANGLILAIEGSGNIDFLIGCGAKGSDELQQDTVGTCLKLLTLVVKYDILVARTTAHQACEGQQRQ